MFGRMCFNPIAPGRNPEAFQGGGVAFGVGRAREVSRQAGVAVPAVDRHDDDDHRDVGPEEGEDRQSQDDEGKTRREVDPGVDEVVDEAAEAGGEKAQKRPDDRPENRPADGEDEGEAKRIEKPREDVASQFVRPEGMRQGGERHHETGREVHVLEPVGRDPRSEKARDEEEEQKRGASRHEPPARGLQKSARGNCGVRHEGSLKEWFVKITRPCADADSRRAREGPSEGSP